MIRLRLTMILWVSWISSFFFFLCHFNSFHTGSVTRKQKIILFFYQVFGAFIWILHSALIISLFFFTSSTSLLFLLCLLCPRSCASFCRIQRSDSQMRQQVCRFAVSVSCRFWFLPLSIFSQLVFWNVKICPSAAFTAVVSASVRCWFFHSSLPFVSLHQSFPSKWQTWEDVLLVSLLIIRFFFLLVFFSPFFVCCLCSLPRSSHVSALKMKTSVLSAVCCLRSESFSSGSLPHAASLTARVKRTDPPRIANVLRGNQLNYAHCGGEGIHNTGIKLLKVTQYLALQLPAVYRRRGMFRRADVHMSCACVGRETDWGQTWRVMAYIGLQCSPQRCEMTVCWQIPS